MSTPRPGPPTGPTRRQLTAGGIAVAVLGLAGCTDGSDGSDGSGTGTDGSVGSGAGTADEQPALPQLRQNPDHDLVVASLAAEQAHLDRLVATRRRHARLRAPLGAAAAVHEAHVQLLQGAVEESSGSGTANASPTPDATETVPWAVPTTPTRALAALAASAGTVARSQAGVATSARSGTFARLAAGMAAAAAQQQRVLPGLRPTRRGAGG